MNGFAGIFIALALLFGGCTTSSTQTAFYRPANYAGAPYRISGTYQPSIGLNGGVIIKINDQEVSKIEMPVFSNTAEGEGTFEGKAVTIVLTRISTTWSSYIRVEVTFENERAVTLAF